MAAQMYACSMIAHEAEESTSTGLSPNVAAALSYVLGWISGLVTLLIERDNRFVRFHALQSILVFAPLTALAIGMAFVPVAVWPVDTVLVFGGFLTWVTLITEAAFGRTCSVPVAGVIAEQQVKAEEYEGGRWGRKGLPE